MREGKGSMLIVRALVLGGLLALVASCAMCDTIVYQEDFSAPFVEREWIYNNSGCVNADGYPGGQPTQRWPAMVSDDGTQILGYEPNHYYHTGFEAAGNPPFPVGSLSGVDGWTGSGSIVNASPNPGQCARFRAQGAFRNATSGMQRTVQYVQCYARVSWPNRTGYIYAGTTDAAAIAAAVRFGANGKIEALDGNRTGGGTWVALANYLAANWYCIRIKLDYGVGAYGVYVDDVLAASGLGFRDSAASSGLNTIKLEQPDGACDFDVDNVYLGNSPYPPGPSGARYWSETYNHRCVNYGDPLHDTWDTYDWMSCYDLAGNPVNTDPTRPGPYRAALPAGWTAGFGSWAHRDPSDPRGYFSSGRGKMGFGRLMGAYAQSPDNPCLHIWSSQGDMRVVSPPITTGPGVYTLSWKASVWNGNTANALDQYKWTDWCQWGFGYTNWSAWDEDPITKPPYTAQQDNQITVNRFWVWQKDPFRDSDPTHEVPHPAGEQPGQWNQFSRTFAFGEKPVRGAAYLSPIPAIGLDTYEFGQEPGYFIGFNVAHAHDPWNAGYEWATILNIDDIVLTKKDPVTIGEARALPEGTPVEIDNLVITNIIQPASAGDYVDVFLQHVSESGIGYGGITVRLWFPDYRDFWDSRNGYFLREPGEVVKVVGVTRRSATGTTYIGDWHLYSMLPSITFTDEPPVDVKPVGVINRDLVGAPVCSGLSTDGMLVTIFGRVNHPVTTWPRWFYVDDGARLPAGETYWGSGQRATGVKIDCTRLVAEGWWDEMIPDSGSCVAVTGTLTTTLAPDGRTVVRVVYPRSPEDIRLYTGSMIF